MQDPVRNSYTIKSCKILKLLSCKILQSNNVIMPDIRKQDLKAIKIIPMTTEIISYVCIVSNTLCIWVGGLVNPLVVDELQLGYYTCYCSFKSGCFYILNWNFNLLVCISHVRRIQCVTRLGLLILS